MKELVNSFETRGNGFWITSSSVDTDKIVIANILNKNHWCHYGKVLADANKWSNHENFWPNCKHMTWLIIAKTDFSKGLLEALYLLKRWGWKEGRGRCFLPTSIIEHPTKSVARIEVNCRHFYVFSVFWFQGQ